VENSRNLDMEIRFLIVMRLGDSIKHARKLQYFASRVFTLTLAYPGKKR
jgi:hypothetical protein